MRHAATALFVVLLAVGSLSAATFESIPTDRQLLDRADLVVVARVLDAATHETPTHAIYTDSVLEIEEIIKGSHSAPTLVVSQLGGFVNGRGIVIAGSAQYAPGSRVLTFLRQRADGTYFTASMGLGKYRLDRARDGREFAVRDGDGIESASGDALDVRPAAEFIATLRSGAADHTRSITSLASEIPTELVREESAGSYSLTGPGGIPIRWDNGGVATFVVSGTQGSLGSAAIMAVENALAAWTNDPLSMISLSKSSETGTKDSTSPIEDRSFDPNYTVNDIVLGHSGSGMPSFCDNGIGCGIAYIAGPNHNYRGVEFYSIKYGDVVLLDSATSNATHLEALLAHEVGHALGFRHSNSGSPSSTNALMNSNPPLAMGATLRDWDQEAAAEVYGNGLPCAPVSITGTSGGGSVPYGSSPTLSVSVTGKSPFTYQWYEGTTGDTSKPIAGATFQNFNPEPVIEPKSFWVQVKNCSGANTANSAAITVTPQECVEPVFITNLGAQSKRINPGTSTTLSVQVSGTLPLSFQWYEGATGNTTKRVGTNSATFTTPILNTSTSYWVRVSNCNGLRWIDSQTAVITVGLQCEGATIAQHPSSVHIGVGDTATFTVVAAGEPPFTYQWYAGESPNTSNPIAGATAASYTTPVLTAVGETKYWVQIKNCNGANTANSNTATATVVCPSHVPLHVFTPAITHFSVPFEVSWDAPADVYAAYELQESTDNEFSSNLKTFTITGETSFTIEAKGPLTEDTRFYYRVRGLSSCAGASEYSQTSSTAVTKSLPAASSQFSISVPEGAHLVPQAMFIPGFESEATPGDSFAVTIDVPWLTASPSSGPLPGGGRNVELTANTASLETGTTSATITVTRTQGAAARIGSLSTSKTTSIPFSISLVTPVAPIPRDTTPPPGTLIIPAVIHGQGIGTFFQSDIRLLNASSQPIEYQLSFTPSGQNGTAVGKKTTLVIPANDVKSIDDIVKAWYGSGILGEPNSGTIEIRPLNNSDPHTTYASSRTYAISANGTLGQFIPAVPLNQFIGNISVNPLATISLQQIANSTAYRTNFGWVEGTGQTAQIALRLFDGSNNLLRESLQTVPPYGHGQNSFAGLFPNLPLEDGRVEVRVLSPGGKVTANASVIDNKTNDPLMVFAAQPALVKTGRYVIPGIAEVQGSSLFASDMRIYNGGSAAEQLTLNYFPQKGEATPRPAPVQLSIAPGQVLAIDKVLPTLWGIGQTGGAVSIDASPESSLVVTARTYSPLPDGGTNGQFIAGLTADDAVGLGERALQVLQLEQSPQYRSNYGLVEVTGKSAVVEVIAYNPAAKVNAATLVNLAPNEFIQFGFIFNQMGFQNVYGGRIAARVVGGEGRVASFASVVDMKTSDPTYVPSQ